MSAVLGNDLAATRAESGVELGELFVAEKAKWLWNMRLGQIEADLEASAVISMPGATQGRRAHERDRSGVRRDSRRGHLVGTKVELTRSASVGPL
jgi:hypothetical protein